MTTFEPREPYSQLELSQLYPSGLILRQVQVVLRHGERSPVSPRFLNAGLSPYWPYCNSARQMKSIIMTTPDAANWDVLQWTRKLETFRENDLPFSARGPNGERDIVCLPGETTDKGRATTYALGERLRKLYIDQLKFMPSDLTTTSNMLLRATPFPRALDAVQQSFSGMYPTSHRTQLKENPTIHLRIESEENLFDIPHVCKRYHKVFLEISKRTAQRWNDTPEMKYINSKIGKWMPEENARGVQIDSHPRLSGVMDTMNSTHAHGPETRLPSEFYDEKLRATVDKIVTEEWFSGYLDNEEYRRLGKGQMMGDVTQRMLEVVQGRRHMVSGKEEYSSEPLKFTMAGAHDTTIAGVLAAMGAFYGEKWPPFTSHLAIELFQKDAPIPSNRPAAESSTTKIENPKKGWFSSLFSSSSPGSSTTRPGKTTIAQNPRAPVPEYATPDRTAMQDYYVRIRYNDRPVTIPSCRKPGRHLQITDENGQTKEDETFCTLEAFKAVADAFIPKDWKAECLMKLDETPDVSKIQPAGWPAGEGPDVE